MSEVTDSIGLVRDAVLRIGTVSGIDGRKISIAVDKNKNSSSLLLGGEIIKNVSVGAYVEIRKGYLSIIGKAEGEALREEPVAGKASESDYEILDRNRRFLTVSLSGYIGADGRFKGGIKELPLIGNEAYILTEGKIHEIHNLLRSASFPGICIARTEVEEIPVTLPIDRLFNSHIAIFGNTGSGKSNTLASMYQEMIKVLSPAQGFHENCQFLLLDFNGEYESPNCITSDKKVYSLSTRTDGAHDKIPMSRDRLLDPDTLSVLVEATEKTQKPFLRRALRFFRKAKDADDFVAYLRGILTKQLKKTLQMAQKDVGLRLLDYMEEALRQMLAETEMDDIRDDIEFFGGGDGKSPTFKKRGQKTYFDSNPDAIKDTKLYRAIESITAENCDNLSELDEFYIFLHLKLIDDLYEYKVQHDHIYHVINRFRAKKPSIVRTFEVKDKPDFWDGKNFAVVSLRDVNLDMRKTIPLLLAKNVYRDHKELGNEGTLNIIVDEAHNILSRESFRETEEWKDYRLETFEEIVKEGRKFGVFMTIASQRPNDISETIISQAHNYFIHQLINQKDLLAVGKAVSYIDKVTEESIPTLPVGTCIFSGIATPMPLKLAIQELPDPCKPKSQTLRFEDVVGKPDPD